MGLCSRCGESITGRVKTCGKCNKFTKEQWYRKQGLCANCGKVKCESYLCPGCYESRKDRVKLARCGIGLNETATCLLREMTQEQRLRSLVMVCRELKRRRHGKKSRRRAG